MLDIILDSLGLALLLGQAIYFWISTGASIVAILPGHSVIPATGHLMRSSGETGRD